MNRLIENPIIIIAIIAVGAYIAYLCHEFYQFVQKCKLAPILCINCAYYSNKMCQHPDHLDLVTGEGKYSCSSMRANSHYCGRFANFYKEKG